MSNDVPVFVSFPLDDLLALRRYVEEYPVLCDEVKSLSRRLEGCYSLYGELACKFGDLARRMPGTGATTT